MQTRRVERVNSLLREVITEVIQKEVKNPHLPEFVSITNIEVSKDLQHAKVFISVIGEEPVKTKAAKILNSAAGFIAGRASKKINLRYFPELIFILDDSLDKHMRIHNLIAHIEEERSKRVITDE